MAIDEFGPKGIQRSVVDLDLHPFIRVFRTLCILTMGLCAATLPAQPLCQDWAYTSTGTPGGLVIAPNGDIVVLDFAPDPYPSRRFIRLGKNGQFLAQQSTVGERPSFGSMVLDRDGNILATGFGTSSNAYTAVYDLAGNSLLALSEPSAWGKAVAASNDGGILVVGGAGSRIRASSYDAIGNTLWVRDEPGPLNSQGTGAAFDLTGNAFVAGYKNNLSLELKKYDAGGDTLWARSYTGSFNYLYSGPICLDGAGNVYTSARVSDFGTATGIHLLKYGPDGTLLWSRVVENSQTYSTPGIACQPDGTVALVGATAAEFRFYVVIVDADGNILRHSLEEQDNGASENIFAAWDSDKKLVVAGGRVGGLYVRRFRESSCQPTPTPPAGVRELGQGASFVFPEPVRGGTAQLGFSLSRAGNVELTVFNAASDPIARVSEFREPGKQTLLLNTGQYSPGVYFYSLSVQYSSGDSEQFRPGKFRVIR